MSNLYPRSWRQRRAKYLSQHPCCVYCLQQGVITPATVVDHVVPHRGDMALFNDPTNMQPLCKTCHDGAKQSLEKTGHLRGSDVTGRPLDPRHPWFRGVDE